MRKHIVAANWKMNKNLVDGLLLAKTVITDLATKPSNATVVIAPPFIHLGALHQLLANSKTVKLAAQNCHQMASGAYTGEVSADMLVSVGVEYVILGHSERREYNKETDALILAKMRQAFAHGLKVIYCCGEPLAVRENQEQEAYVLHQLEESILNLTQEEIANTVIAYEPIWAIGTGLNATPEQAQEMHSFIRQSIKALFGSQVAEDISILYGGSVKPDNARFLFSQPDVDGGLIGGASLVATDFISIAHSF